MLNAIYGESFKIRAIDGSISLKESFGKDIGVGQNMHERK
jgi:hypothetical protein